MVEVILTCIVDNEPFVKNFADPVNWDEVNKLLSEKQPRCENHPDAYACWDYE